MLNYRSLGIRLGEGLQTKVSVLEISKKASEIFDFAMTLHPDESATSPRSQMIHDWVKSLAEMDMDEEKKLDLLQKFIDSLTSEDNPLRNLIKETEDLPGENFWDIINLNISISSRKKFDHGYYSDAVAFAFQAVHKKIGDIVLERTGEKLKGEELMKKAFCGDEPLVVIDNISSKEGKLQQRGFCGIYSGAFCCVDKAQTNIEKKEAVHLLFLTSLLMNKLETARY